MKKTLRVLLVALSLAPSLIIVPVAAAADAAYVVSYVDAVPATAGKAAGMMRQFAGASRKDAGYVRIEVLQRIDYPDQFAILEVWADQKAQEAHAAAAHTREFREKLKPLLRAPYDERPHIVLSVAPATGKRAAGGQGAIYAVTHVDVIGKAKDQGTLAVKELSEASRGGPGNLRFDSLTQTSRPNHMTVVEIWKDRKSLQANGASAHFTLFRDKLQPLTGALYDERHYKAIN